MNRREYLTTGTFIGLLATAGCLGWRDSGDAGDAEDDDQGTDADTDDPETDTDPEDEYDDHSDDYDEEEDEDEDRDDEEKQEDEEDDGDDPYPDEEDTEIDRDQYDDHDQEREERIERDSDAIEVEADADVDDYGGLTIEGTVTNVSDEPVDRVRLEISVFDPDDEYLWGDTVGIEDLAPGASEGFESGWTADEERGELGSVEIEETVYDLAG